MTSALAQDLSDLIPREPQNLCPVCTLYKTLPDHESHALREAIDITRVGVEKIVAALLKHNISISSKRIYTHRNLCTDEQ